MVTNDIQIGPVVAKAWSTCDPYATHWIILPFGQNGSYPLTTQVL